MLQCKSKIIDMSEQQNIQQSDQIINASEGNDDDFEDIDSNEEDDFQKESQSQQLPQLQSSSKHKCPHYERNCHVEASCCKTFYPCKLCHDEKYQYKKGCQMQRMEFEKVQNVKCLECQQIQPASQYCRNEKCQIKFGEYACLKCMLYENNPNKKNDIFHCDDCKMCRRGNTENTFHCFKCGYCRPIVEKDNHKCVQNVAESKCPICLEVLKYSTKYYQDFPCGHLIHVDCLKKTRDVNCPICGMAIIKSSKEQNDQLQTIIDQTKDNLPEELKNLKVNVLCNQCLHKTMNAPFHFYGSRCEKCGTFNTKKI